ncbi:MAG: alpha/beta hydrolase, partial [Proteobacteria bacterium]|nr:alpha/beta hydrolase [Pseudomonadota bacterium]
GYTPLSQDDGAWHLLKAGADTVWDVDWAGLRVPVLNVTGRQDRIFRDDAVVARLLGQFQNVRAVDYAEAGHMIPAEAPARLARDILEFAEGL